MIRSITRGFIDGRFASFLNWPLIGAMYTSIPYNEMGLIMAHEPWSGNYSVGKTVWVSAHVTQFTRIGWTYVSKSSGYLGGDERNGTFITLKSPSGNDYSIILEATCLPPKRGAMPLPYLDDLDGYATGSEARYLSNLQGDFQSRPRHLDGRKQRRRLSHQF